MSVALDAFLARWYAASIGREDKSKVLSDFAAACERDASLKTEATSRKLRPNDPILKRDHISRVHNDFLERIT